MHIPVKRDCSAYLEKNRVNVLIFLRGVKKMATFDKRRYRRSSIVSAVEYALHPLHTDETFDGVIMDISEAGLCLLTNTPLKKGQEISLKINPSAFSQPAAVRWSRQYDALYCRAGLEFIERMNDTY